MRDCLEDSFMKWCHGYIYHILRLCVTLQLSNSVIPTLDRHSILFFLKKLWWKKKTLSWKYLNSLSFAVFTNKISFSDLGINLSSKAKFSLLDQGFICETYIFSKLYYFWTDIWTELANKNLYKTSIGEMGLRFLKL